MFLLRQSGHSRQKLAIPLLIAPAGSCQVYLVRILIHLPGCQFPVHIHIAHTVIDIQGAVYFHAGSRKSQTHGIPCLPAQSLCTLVIPAGVLHTVPLSCKLHPVIPIVHHGLRGQPGGILHAHIAGRRTTDLHLRSFLVPCVRTRPLAETILSSHAALAAFRKSHLALLPFHCHVHIFRQQIGHALLVQPSRGHPDLGFYHMGHMPEQLLHFITGIQHPVLSQQQQETKGKCPLIDAFYGHLNTVSHGYGLQVRTLPGSQGKARTVQVRSSSQDLLSRCIGPFQKAALPVKHIGKAAVSHQKFPCLLQDGKGIRKGFGSFLAIRAFPVFLPISYYPFFPCPMAIGSILPAAIPGYKGQPDKILRIRNGNCLPLRFSCTYIHTKGRHTARFPGWKRFQPPLPVYHKPALAQIRKKEPVFHLQDQPVPFPVAFPYDHRRIGFP